MSKPSVTDTDVVIVGGGTAGLCLARALNGSGLRILLIESAPAQALTHPPADGREIALTHASRAILETLGIWDRLPEEAISVLRDAAVFDGESTSALRITHEDGQADCLGWLVSNRAIKQAAMESVGAQDDFTLWTDTRVTHTAPAGDHRELTLEDGRVITARLVIAADSRFSSLRRVAGIGARQRDFGQSMLLARMSLDGDHEHVAWEWFGYDRTLALLPLNGREASVVITLPHARIEALNDLDEAAFNQTVTDMYRHRLGEMKLSSERYIYPLIGVWPDRLVDDRIAVLGDAAVGMHPVTAHGFNLGLKGVSILAKEMTREPLEQFDDPRRLLNYQRRHRRSSLPLYLATSAVVGLYSDTRWPAKWLRRSALQIANRLWPFRRAVAKQLTG